LKKLIRYKLPILYNMIIISNLFDSRAQGSITVVIIGTLYYLFHFNNKYFQLLIQYKKRTNLKIKKFILSCIPFK